MGAVKHLRALRVRFYLGTPIAQISTVGDYSTCNSSTLCSSNGTCKSGYHTEHSPSVERFLRATLETGSGLGTRLRIRTRDSSIWRVFVCLGLQKLVLSHSYNTFRYRMRKGQIGCNFVHARLNLLAQLLRFASLI